MTVRKNPKGELEEVKASWTTSGFRWGIIVLILSMHPVGRVFLGQMGFVLPDQAAEKKTSEEVQTLKSDVAEVKKDISSMKSSVETLTRTVTGFQIDFERYRRDSHNK